MPSCNGCFGFLKPRKHFGQSFTKSFRIRRVAMLAPIFLSRGGFPFSSDRPISGARGLEAPALDFKASVRTGSLTGVVFLDVGRDSLGRVVMIFFFSILSAKKSPAPLNRGLATFPLPKKKSETNWPAMSEPSSYPFRFSPSVRKPRGGDGRC